MSAWGRRLAAAALTLAAGAAAASESAGPAEADTRAVYGGTTSGGSFYVEWSPEPAPVPLNELFTVRFRVLEPADRTTVIAGAALAADAWMPDHGHGTTLAPLVESHGDGTATGEGFLLHREGRWELRVGVAVDGRMERAVFEIVLEP
jgi:hypothetical protein